LAELWVSYEEIRENIGEGEKWNDKSLKNQSILCRLVKKISFFYLFKQLVSHDEDVSHDGDGERQEEAVKPDEVVEEDHDEAAAEDADVFHHRK
jgi:hypothetical protein